MHRKNRAYNLLIIVLFFSLPGYSQFNTYMNFDEDYIKIKVVEDGFYRITSGELVSAGMPSNVPASRIKLYRKGQQVSTRKQSNSDGTLQNLIFYGQRNDGSSDEELYIDGAIHHPYYNIFTDSAVYFLTWTSTASSNAIQINNRNDDQGLTPDLYQFQRELVLPVDQYLIGDVTSVPGVPRSNLRSSEYTLGEGWTSNRLAKNQFRDFDLPVTQVYSGVNSTLSIRLQGSNGQSHNASISLETSPGSFEQLGADVLFTGYQTRDYSVEFDAELFQGEDNETFRVTAQGFPSGSESICISYMELFYPQEFTLSGSNKTFYLAPSALGRTVFELPLGLASDYEFFDLSDPLNPIQLVENTTGDRLKIVVDQTQSMTPVYALANLKSVASLELKQNAKIDLSSSDYLIIYHPFLNSGNGPVDRYKDYRESTGYSVTSLPIDDIFDQYNFGDPSPLAIKRLVREGYGNLEHVFIIGKGYTPFTNYYRDQSDTLGKVHIPTYGFPGGDLPYSTDLDPQLPDLPAITVGRLVAKKPEHVSNYLDKVIEFEQNGFDELWRKDVIQLSGGQTTTELRQFEGYISGYSRNLESNFLGARTLNKAKATTAVVERFDGDVPQWINRGVGSMLLFGHSSSQVTDIDIGRVSNSSYGYNNKGKYPIILVNGCNAGDIFSTVDSFGEDWIIAKDKGAVAFMANSWFALSNTLREFTARYYQYTYQMEENFGNTLGANIEKVGRFMVDEFRQSGFYDAYVIQIQQEILHGDPAIRPFAADKPDFSFTDDGAGISSFTRSTLTAEQDSIKLSMEVKNLGKTTLDSLRISVSRTFPDASRRDTIFIVPSVKRLDTLNFALDNTNPSEGLNSFSVTLDEGNEIEELNESNNQLSFDAFIIASKTINVLPVNRAVVDTSVVQLLWQHADPLEKSASYVLEIDTVEDMENGSLFKKELVLEGNSIKDYHFEINQSEFTDTTTFFWRTRVANPLDKSDSTFSTSSFTYAPNANEGWGLFSQDQFQQMSFDGLSLTDAKGVLEFDINTSFLQLSTNNFDSLENVSLEVEDVNYLIVDTLTNNKCRINTINAIVFDGTTAQLERLLFLNTGRGDEAIAQLCGRINPQLIYNFNVNDINNGGYMNQLIDAMDLGDKIVIFNIDSVAYSQLDAGFFTKLEEVGLAVEQVENLLDGDALILRGEKGASAGSMEVIRDAGKTDQFVDLEYTVRSEASSGSFETPIAGPASSWSSIRLSTVSGENDSIRIVPTFISATGKTRTLQELSGQEGRVEEFNLSAISAREFPFLQMQVFMEDRVDKTPPRLNYVNVEYEITPEGLFYIDDTSKVELDEGEEYKLSLYFINVTDKNFTDSIDLNYSVLNNETGDIFADTDKFAPLNGHDTIVYNFSLNTVGRVGLNNLRADFRSSESELIDFNNQLSFERFLSVKEDETPPVVDVTVDGRYIMDGDIVSPDPVILIKLQDENPYFNTSESNLVISIQEPGENEPAEIDNSKLTIEQEGSNEQPLEVSYRPGPLDDGVYTLFVEARDASGNSLSGKNYEISFEVISESTITHFYPYPNPFSTSCRFVFTLTGSQLPDQLKVQIMTVSGRVVREIDLAEFGDIHIGNNISEFVWDGTDEYGDQLANGVYFYRVISRIDWDDIKRRPSAGDKGFKNGFGKLYILR